MDVGVWLRGLGFVRYEQAFRDNDVDADLLAKLTAEDLKEIGVASVGHRRRLLDAAAALRAGQVVAPPEARADTEPPRTGPERRQLTVMFVDLVGSTALSRRLDPEEMSGVLRAYQDAVEGGVARFEGHVAKFLGDGVLCYFGWPRAQEDAAERAVRAALSLVAAVGRLAAPGGGEALACRVGIATGLVVVGELIGEGAAREEAVVGETPNLAARLQAEAGSREVVVAGATRRLLGGLFEVEALALGALKGFEDAGEVGAFRVLGEGCAEGRFEALRGLAGTPLVGRERELAVLLDRWARAGEGRGRVVLLSGEPGIGKSRLVQALRDRLGAAEPDPPVVLRYQCSPHHAASALWPVVAQLERAAGIARDGRSEADLDRLEALLGRAAAGAGVATAAPLLADLLGLPGAAGRYPPRDLTPRRRKELTFEALLAQLAGLAKGRPVLAVLEDAHWIDPTSLELFGMVAARIERLPVLLVVTFRPEFQAPWAGEPHATALALGRLGPEDARTLAERVAGGRALRPELLETIRARTDGVPLFVEELTKAVLDNDAPRDAAGEPPRPGSGPLPEAAVPASLHDALMARLDRLAPVRELAQVAAVIGREFGHELLAAVAGAAEAELRRALAGLIAAELVFARGEPGPGAAYSFKHALVRDAAYESLLKSRRHQLHARVAAALEERWPETGEVQPELLAHHYAEAGLAAKAIAYCLAAGRRAVARSAMAEAEAQLRKGLDLLASLPDGEERLRHELDLRVTLGRALIASQGYAAPAVGDAYARALRLCERLGGEPPQLVPALYGLWVHQLLRNELGSAREMAERTLRLGEARGETPVRLMGSRLTGITRLLGGEPAAARSHLERGLALFDPADRPFYAALAVQDAKVTLLTYLSHALLYIGHLDQARSKVGEALGEARRLEHAFTLAHALHQACFVDCITRSRASLREHAEVVIAVAGEQRFPYNLACGTIFRGWLVAAEGRAEEGVALLTRGLADYRATGSNQYMAYFLCLLAEVCGGVGQPEEGLRHLDQAVREVEATDERWCEAEVHRLRGELLAAVGDRAAAETGYREALRVARRQGARLWELRAATGLARLWRGHGRGGEARELLAPVHGWFTEGRDTPDLREAAALLRQLGGVVRTGRAAAAGRPPVAPGSPG